MSYRARIQMLGACIECIHKRRPISWLVGSVYGHRVPKAPQVDWPFKPRRAE